MTNIILDVTTLKLTSLLFNCSEVNLLMCEVMI